MLTKQTEPMSSNYWKPGTVLSTVYEVTDYKAQHKLDKK